MRAKSAAVLLLTFLSAPTRADLILEVSIAEVPASSLDQTGFFEIYVASSELPQPQISAHQLQISIDISSGITFESAGGTTGRTYLGPSAAPTTSVSPDKSTIDSGDFDLLTATPLFDGAGLLRVEYHVAGGTPPGSYAIQFNNAASFLADENGALLATSVATVSNAPTIKVSAIPEPTAAAYMVLVVLLGSYRWWRQRITKS